MDFSNKNLQAISNAASRVAGTVDLEYDLVFVNRAQRREEVIEIIDGMRDNLVCFSETLISDNDELTKLAPYFLSRYPSFLQGREFAVVFIDRAREMRDIKELYGISDKGWSQNDYRGTCLCGGALIDKYLEEEYRERGKRFQLPVSIREGSKLSEPCDLLGCCALMSGAALMEYCPPDDRTAAFGLNSMREYPTIFLCVEALNLLALSFRECEKGMQYKRLVGERFGVGISDGYFKKNALRLTLAHEFAHLLFGHYQENVKNKMNRETQANFLASILLNDPVASIYMLYKSYFHPAEYQRTLLLYNDFGITEIGDALVEALILE